MNLLNRLRNPLITGTLLLTATGMLSRVIGFFYRIFLSRTIGAEGLGIYQLIFPILSLCIAFAASGIQTSISRFVAASQTGSQKNAGISFLYAGMVISVFLSFLTCAFMISCSDFLAETILDEPRCAELLKVTAYSLPCACIHSCINGYYYGLKRTFVPAFTQLLEQVVRVASVYVMYLITLEQHQTVTPVLAVWGIVCGEFASMLVSVTLLRFYKRDIPLAKAARSMASFAVPLTMNHVISHLFGSVEAILIPISLKSFGYCNSDALSVFGILNGMAIPMVLFPSAIVNSVCVLLLPTVSEIHAKADYHALWRAVRTTISYCLILGFLCTGGFLLTGRFIGQFIFHNSLAGTFIVILSWICPFLYLSATLSSVLHGLGRANSAFAISLIGCGVRIGFIFFLIPIFGIRSYLYGMLISHLLTSGLCLYALLSPKRGAITVSNHSSSNAE